MKEKIKQDIKIAVCGILTLLCLVLTVLELIPEKKSGIVVKDTVTVYSAPTDSFSGIFENTVAGSLFNETDAPIVIDALTVRVSDGKTEKDIPVDLSQTTAYASQQLDPRTKLEFSVTEFSGCDFSKVEEVRITVKGELYQLSNMDQSAISIVAILLIALLLIFGFMLYRSIMVRYYMYKEPTAEAATEEPTAKMPAEKSETAEEEPKTEHPAENSEE